MIDEACAAFEAADWEAYAEATIALSEYQAEEALDPAVVTGRVAERCPAIQDAGDAIQDRLEDQQEVADRQEQLIEVRVTECGPEEASGTITNGNAVATRVSIVIWFELDGGLLLTGAAHASPIGAGETRTWTAEATGGEVSLDAEQRAALECEVESVVAFPL